MKEMVIVTKDARNVFWNVSDDTTPEEFKRSIRHYGYTSQNVVSIMPAEQWLLENE